MTFYPKIPFRKAPFPNLFPPPEIWNQIPPFSDKRRKIGAVREAIVIGTVGATLLGVIGVGGSTFIDILNEPVQRTATETDITKECIIGLAVKHSPASFILNITTKEDPVGTKLEGSIGPIHSERTVISGGSPSIFGGELDEPQTPTSVNGNEYSFDRSTFAHELGNYTVYFGHSTAITTRFGPVKLGVPINSILSDPCGSIAVDARGGTVSQVIVTEQ